MITKKFTNEQYCISLKISVEGTIESVDVIGSLYKQLQDVLPKQIHFETLVKEGKIGLISVSITKEKSRSIAHCQIPTSLDFSTTCLLAAKCEQITKIGHTHGVVEVTNIGHSHQELETTISNRAKELEAQFTTQDNTSNASGATVKTTQNTQDIENKLVSEIRPNCFSTPECIQYIKNTISPQIILVEGRSDVKTLSYFGYKNVISTNGSFMSVLQLQDENWFKSAQFFACLDGDSSAKKLLTQYKDHFSIVNEVFALKGKEVSFLSFKQVERLIKKLNITPLTTNNSINKKENKNKKDKDKNKNKNNVYDENEENKQDELKSNSNSQEQSNQDTNESEIKHSDDTSKQVIEKQHFTKHEYIALENYISLIKNNSRIVGFDSTMGLLFDKPLSKLKNIDYSNCSIILLDGLFENSLYSRLKNIETLYCVIARGFNDSYSNLLTITFNEFENSSLE